MLGDDAIARYARQIVVPGIGAAGQEKLLRSTVLVVGHPRGCATAGLYLRAAGVRVVTSADFAATPADAVVVADAAALDAAERASVLALARPLCWYAAEGAGFVSGVHPEAPLPSPAPSGDTLPAVHDAAACEAASVACAILLGLAVRRGRSEFRI